MKGLVTILLGFAAVCCFVACGQHKPEQVTINPDAINNFAKSPDVERSYPPAPSYDPTPPSIVQAPESGEPAGLLETLIKNQIDQRAPQALESILGNREDAELVAEMIQYAPGVWEKITARSESESRSPIEVIGGEALTAIIKEQTANISIPPEMGKDLPEAIENVKKSADDGSLLEMIGAIVLREVLDNEE